MGISPPGKNTHKEVDPACVPFILKRGREGEREIVVTCMDTSSSGEICFEFLRLELIPSKRGNGVTQKKSMEHERTKAVVFFHSDWKKSWRGGE